MKYLFLFLFACSQKQPATSTDKTVESQTSTPSAEKSIEVEQWENYGAEFTIEKSIPASQLLASPETYVDQKIKISGTVSDVCQKMGCWMVISEEDKHMRITTKDHKFFVAKDGAGSKCEIEGIVVKKGANKERAEHYASEQSEGAPVPAGEINNTATYEIVAQAIRFQIKEDAK